ncbi:MAG TPA: hypothetical protein VGS96_09345, partial [Thermoanaerobaculia bacterium]|nr:hypothetical protein [Thermoanaerobaculia bacterium]
AMRWHRRRRATKRSPRNLHQPEGLRAAQRKATYFGRTTLAIIALLVTSCGSMLPWRGEAPASEVNLAFTIQNNLLFLTTTEINNHPARMFFGTAQPRTLVDPAFADRARTRRYSLQLNQRESLPFTPLVVSLGGLGDALIGSDVWGSHAVTIDYRSGLLTYQKDGIHPDEMTLFRWRGEPSILVHIDGHATTMIVDTALPDTIVLPRGAAPASRRTAHVMIAGTDFGNVDIAIGDVTQARIGNRLLSKFLVSVDYGRKQVGLWRDPRIPM